MADAERAKKWRKSKKRRTDDFKSVDGEAHYLFSCHMEVVRKWNQYSAGNVSFVRRTWDGPSASVARPPLVSVFSVGATILVLRIAFRFLSL